MLSAEQMTLAHESIGKYECSAVMLVKFLLDTLISVTNTRSRSRMFFLFPNEFGEDATDRNDFQSFYPTTTQVLDTEMEAKYTVEMLEETLCSLASKASTFIGEERKAEYSRFQNEIGVYFKQYFEDMDELKIPFEIRNPGLYSNGKEPRVCFKDILDLLPAFKCNSVESSELLRQMCTTINTNEILSTSIVIKRICSMSSQMNADLVNLHLKSAIGDEVLCQNSRMLRVFVEASVIRYKIMDSLFFINQLDCEVVCKANEEPSALMMITQIVIGLCVLAVGCILKLLCVF
ncbi:hypothetical protein HK407_04g07110 [Ordospora pajunii]|uniref:uncharacterized protein n=1 Tax=Ordospora pajunii TaxID=3039483 RepID=UPI0029528BD1|nr:uncharacterized protein HK407_04g07110 [Ordospora pajunii]KAH9411606.1 hypothetical protein HK407_04g07110 [Ordospora pajunii]